MKNFGEKGFTLIELLVVISIIGLLSSIVLVSLAGARNRAKDSRISASMGQMRNVSEVYLGNSSSYSGLCATADVILLRDDICAQKGQTAGCGTPHWECYDATGDFCAKSQLNSGNWWCADSALKSQQYSSNPVCSSTARRCQ